MAWSIPVQLLPEEALQAQSVFEIGLCRDNHGEMKLDQESSERKQIPAEDRQRSWLLEGLSSPYL